MRSREVKLLTRGLTTLGGSLLAIGAGLAFSHYIFADALARLSYDLPFIWSGSIETGNEVIVYLDDDSAKKLKQSAGEAWDRRLHAQLLDRLTQDGARLVFFDIVFDQAAPDPAQDEALSEALQRNGRAILGGGVEFLNPLSGIGQMRVLPPIRPLRKAAAGWGLLAFSPIDPDYGVRRIYLGTPDLPSSTWRAAEALNPDVARQPRESGPPRWINYYGKPDHFLSVSYAQVIQPEGLPPGYFKDRVVFVGGRSAVGYMDAKLDTFITPYSLVSGHRSTGVEIHATILRNLVRGEWLTRMSAAKETCFVIAVGLLLGLLALPRPFFATLLAVAAAVLILFVTAALWKQRVWFNWLVPVAVQIPTGLFWSLGAQYYLEARRRKALRRAFGFYLSPQMADQIANSDFDLTPGGRVVEATIMFTDLEGFTSFAEDLDPEEVSQTLIAYFERTSRCILEKKGTIVKYVGDAVMAGWGAPLDDPQHATLAAEAACDLRCLADIELRGRRMRTRIGVNTGKVLAGNLGSSFRFDYSMIGDTTNFASRLENLNKYLGTQVLISEATRSQIDGKFITRPLGEFRAVGKTHSILIHELLCPCDKEAGERAWITVFEEGLGYYRAAEFGLAREAMHRTRELRGGHDGAAEFYLRTMDEVEKSGKFGGWTGIIEMKEK